MATKKRKTNPKTGERPFRPRPISAEQAAQGYNNEGRGKLIGYIAYQDEHEKRCPYRKDKNKTCACRIGLWQEARNEPPPKPSETPWNKK